MELLGPSLWDLCKEKEPILSVEFVAYVAIEALKILECLHFKGCDFGRALAGSGPHGSSTCVPSRNSYGMQSIASP